MLLALSGKHDTVRAITATVVAVPPVAVTVTGELVAGVAATVAALAGPASPSDASAATRHAAATASA